MPRTTYWVTFGNAELSVSSKVTSTGQLYHKRWNIVGGITFLSIYIYREISSFRQPNTTLYRHDATTTEVMLPSKERTCLDWGESQGTSRYDTWYTSRDTDNIAIQRFWDNQSFDDTSRYTHRYIYRWVKNDCEKVKCWILFFIHGTNCDMSLKKYIQLNTNKNTGDAGDASPPDFLKIHFVPTTCKK